MPFRYLYAAARTNLSKYGIFGIILMRAILEKIKVVGGEAQEAPGLKNNGWGLGKMPSVPLLFFFPE